MEVQYKNKLIFEGEYLNEERNGKGKEYNKKGKLEFEGEYLNEERDGKGKEYIFSKKLVDMTVLIWIFSKIVILILNQI